MLKITNGEIYDPINGINGDILDLWVEDGRVVATGEYHEGRAPDEVIDAAGAVVMPGGVDIHAHIAGSKVNLGRKLRPEDHRKDVVPKTKVTRSGVGYSVPTTHVTGYRYAAMGYTTVMEAAVPPLGARHSHEELGDIPLMDKGCYTLMGNNHFVLKFIERGEQDKVRAFVSWLLGATKGYAVKIVNPGGTDSWKWGKNVSGIDDQTIDFKVTPRQILTALVRAHEKLGLPHSIHLHCNNLGVPGNYRTTLQTMEALGESKVHITHGQFNSYGGKSWADFHSEAPAVAEYVNKHSNITLDAGQVVFGDVTTMTADGPWQARLHRLSGNKWVNSDVEMETGAGIVPYRFCRGNLVNAIQWTIGLELMLLIEDPWRVFLTTDHPNAGPFMHYPQIIKILMSKDCRDRMLAGCPKGVRGRTVLESLKREYSLSEIAIITRAGTAKALGLKNKGHLGPGADADIAVYPKDSDKERMFSSPSYVLKGGEVIVKDGKVVKSVQGRTIYVELPPEKWIEDEIKEDFERFYSVSWANYPVQDAYLKKSEVVKCG
ncbi:Formyltransferase/hydrolase complex Fhc subunit A [subsurface metagenome]